MVQPKKENDLITMAVAAHRHSLCRLSLHKDKTSHISCIRTCEPTKRSIESARESNQNVLVPISFYPTNKLSGRLVWFPNTYPGVIVKTGPL